MKRLFLLISLVVCTVAPMVAMDENTLQDRIVLNSYQAIRKANYVAHCLLSDDAEAAAGHLFMYKKALKDTGKSEFELSEAATIIFNVYCELRNIDKTSTFNKRFYTQIIKNFLLENDIKTICMNCARVSVLSIATKDNFGTVPLADKCFHALSDYVNEKFWIDSELTRTRLAAEFRKILDTDFQFCTPQKVYQNLVNWINCCECQDCPKAKAVITPAAAARQNNNNAPGFNGNQSNNNN